MVHHNFTNVIVLANKISEEIEASNVIAKMTFSILLVTLHIECSLGQFYNVGHY